MPAHAGPKPGPIAPEFTPMARRAALTLGALVFGAYLGFSTVAEIDPFYRQPQFSKSYTTDGWRGADAAPPPAATSSVADMGYGDYAYVSRTRYTYPAYADYPSDPDISDELPETTLPETGAPDFTGGANSSAFEVDVAESPGRDGDGADNPDALKPDSALTAPTDPAETKGDAKPAAAVVSEEDLSGPA